MLGKPIAAALIVWTAVAFSACEQAHFGDSCQADGKSGLIGSNDMSCMTCSQGSPSITCGAGCSAATLGVCCCNSGGGGGGGGGGCSAQVCCGGLYECNGRCYESCTPGSQPCCTSTHCTCYTPCC